MDALEEQLRTALQARHADCRSSREDAGVVAPFRTGGAVVGDHSGERGDWVGGMGNGKLLCLEVVRLGALTDVSISDD